MAVKRVIKSVHILAMGMAEDDDGLTLIDAGYPDKEAAVFRAIRGLGRLAGSAQVPNFHSRPSRSYRQQRRPDRAGNRCENQSVDSLQSRLAHLATCE